MHGSNTSTRLLLTQQSSQYLGITTGSAFLHLNLCWCRATKLNVLHVHDILKCLGSHCVVSVISQVVEIVISQFNYSCRNYMIGFQITAEFFQFGQPSWQYFVGSMQVACKCNHGSVYLWSCLTLWPNVHYSINISINFCSKIMSGFWRQRMG